MWEVFAYFPWISWGTPSCAETERLSGDFHASRLNANPLYKLSLPSSMSLSIATFLFKAHFPHLNVDGERIIYPTRFARVCECAIHTL